MTTSFTSKPLPTFNRLLKSLIVMMITSLYSLPSLAIEANISLHQGDESNTQGISFLVSDKITKSGNFYWNIGYSALDDVKVEWNNNELFFKVDTLDAIISYRYQPKTYDQFTKKLTFEYQLGATMALTENKFIWQDLGEEKYFSKSNDINVMLGFGVHYTLSKQSAMNMGFKYQPSFSEFDDITSIYLGFTYKFGSQYGY